MWRTEVWYAMAVHLPIITLCLASAAAVVGVFLRQPDRVRCTRGLVLLLLTIGVAGGWVSNLYR